MRLWFALAVSFLLLSCERTANTITISGELKLIDGSLEYPVIQLRNDWQVNAPLIPLTISKDGRFWVNGLTPDGYILTFSHPGFEPKEIRFRLFENDIYQLNVMLDRYEASVDGRYYVMTELTQFRFSDKMEMKQNGNRYELTLPVPAGIDSVRYQITNGYRSFNGENYLPTVDRYGDFQSVAAVTNGQIRIQFDPTTLRSIPSQSRFTNVRNMELPIAMQRLLAEYRRFRPMIIQKLSAGDSTKTGLEMLFSVIESEIEDLSGRNRIIYEANVMNRFGPFYKRQADVLDAARKLAANDPEAYMNMAMYYQIGRAAAEKKYGPKPSTKQMAPFILNEIEKAEQFKLPTSVLMDLFAEKARYLHATGNVEAQRSLMNTLISRHPDSHLAVYFKRDLKRIEMLAQEAPDLPMKTLDGKSIKLSDFRGKWVLLDVWATWCAPCVAEIPNLIQSYQNLDSKKIEFISICIDSYGDNLKKYIQEKGWRNTMNWVLVGGQKNWDEPVIEAFRINGLPAIYLIDPEGRIQIRNRGLRGKLQLPTLKSRLDGMSLSGL